MRNRLGYVALGACVAILPAVLTLFLVRFHLDSDLRDMIPTYYGAYNDSFFYWRQVATFIHAGFNGGYYTMYELSAPAQFSHFYTHGPMYSLIYGTVGRLIGWQFFTPVLINLMLVTVTLAVFIYILKPRLIQLGLLAITLAVFWPLLLYLPAIMQESLHFSFAILLAALFYRLLNHAESLSFRASVGFTAVLLVFALVRVTWAFMFVPLFVFSQRHRSILSLAMALALAAALIIIMFVVTNFIMAPYVGYYTHGLLQDLKTSLALGWNTFWTHVQTNLGFFHEGNPIMVFQRYQLLTLLVISVVSGLLALKAQRKRGVFQARFLSGKEAWLHVLVLVIPLLFVITLYDFYDTHDFRILAPPMLISVLLLIAFNRRALVSLFVLSCLIVLPDFLTAYTESWSPQFSYDRQAIDDFGAVTQNLLVYDADAKSGWCNTVYIYLRYLDAERAYYAPPELLAVDPGLGISFFLDVPGIRTPIKSRYWILEPWVIDSIPDTHTQILGYTPIGNVYLNLDAEC